METVGEKRDTAEPTFAFRGFTAAMKMIFWRDKLNLDSGEVVSSTLEARVDSELNLKLCLFNRSHVSADHT